MMISRVLSHTTLWLPFHRSTSCNSDRMSRSRHADKKGNKNKLLGSISPSYVEKLSFEVFSEDSSSSSSPLLLTLLFDDKQAQHEALSRIEAFYESERDTQRYLTLEEAYTQKICRHYEAFNFPLGVVPKWLESMKEQSNALSVEGEEQRGQVTTIGLSDLSEEVATSSQNRFWERHCNPQEGHLLQLLERLGIIDSNGTCPTNAMTMEATATSTSVSTSDPRPSYLISTITSKRASLRHERLHFLFYISPEYRKKVQEEYASLTSKALKIIQHDLSMRKYSKHVWMDEFQAYITEDPCEFGKSIQQECQVIQQSLVSHQHALWKDLLLKVR